MDMCRLCLKHRKKLMYIFENDDGTSYADMVTLLTNVKIFKGDGITDQICFACRCKTKELYEFRLQVERSYDTLQENCSLKRIHFSNICDVKLSIEMTENDVQKSIPENIHKNLMNSSKELFNYNDVVIKKIPNNERKPLSVIDFLNTIKGENEIDYGDDYSYEVEIDYDPDLKRDPDFKLQQPPKNYKKRKNTQNSSYLHSENVIVLSKPIKPQFLPDYKLGMTKPKKRANVKSKTQYYKHHICPYCGKMTKSLNYHLATHTGYKPFKCDLCPLAFVLISHLRNHIERKHGPRNVKCDLCVATFTHKYALKAHMLSHFNEKKHVCDICSKPFKLKSGLCRHMRLMHNPSVKPWKCEQCTDTFKSKYGLNHHMRVHTGERPYRCEICSQPYSYKHDFNRHCMKKHGVCFEQRHVYVMNEEVLVQERILMRDLMLRVNGILKDDKPINPFEGPKAALAYGKMMKAIQSGKVVVDLQL